ncbi:unnamed protein product [Colias eurytheme]|nr:unnamed protein product [Colias eurytheme]
MESRVRSSSDQLLVLLEFMENHGDLARPLPGVQGRVRSEQLWADLTNILNALGDGVSKTTEKWKKVWADWKTKTKKKGLTIRQHAGRTEGGPARGPTLSAIEKRVLAVMGSLAVERQASVEELGFNTYQSSAKYDPDAKDHIVYLIESVDDKNSTTRPTRAQEQRPATPSPPASPAPSPTSPRRRLPAPSPPATPPRRRPRLRSPATPQSAASPDRPFLRARRRAPTPFETAASEFAAVELRRLELEETRIRQQHERELRALEVEQERNQVFSRLVDVAQAWLDYYRTRDNTEPLNIE